MKFRLMAIAAILTGMPTAAWGQTLGATDTRGALLGPYAASQMGISLYGTDLGYSVSDGTKLRILFGDSWKDGNGTGLGGFANADDCQGSIDLATFNNGDAVDSWLNNPVRQQSPQWRTDGPTLTMRTNALGSVAPLVVYNGGSGGSVLDMGLGRTPIAAFANRNAANGAVFAFFARQVGELCTSTTSCGTGFTCDTGMGTCNGSSAENAIPCVMGTARCACLYPAGYIGVCQDRTSSAYDTTEDGRILSAVLRNRVGNADKNSGIGGLPIEEQYYTREFLTNKFNNLTSRTVRDFLPTRAYNSTSNVYSPGTGASGGNEKVFLWGRSNYAGYGAWQGKSNKLYFAYVDMPSYSATAAFTFAPKFFSGFGASGCTTGTPAPGAAPNNFPCFSTRQDQALPLDLSNGATACTFTGTDKCSEKYDVVNQHTVSWVPALGKFVMIYGGDAPDSFFSLDVGPNWTHIARNPSGSMYFRYATYPWGPWSAPVAVAVGGVYNPASGQYASNGVFHSPYCSGTCAAMDPHYLFYSDGDKVGRYYGANIVDEWTMTRAANTADIYWFASTWDPYEVIMMRTRINP